MIVKIGSYSLCDGTLSGGVALSELRLAGDRTFDVVLPLGGTGPVLMDRNLTRIDQTFTVRRVHNDANASEAFILNLDTALPRSGDIIVTTTVGDVYLLEGAAINHQLSQQIGATTFHTYRLIATNPLAIPSGPMVTEAADNIITETTDQIITE